jgi:hypothetical protein
MKSSAKLPAKMKFLFISLFQLQPQPPLDFEPDDGTAPSRILLMYASKFFADDLESSISWSSM